MSTKIDATYKYIKWLPENRVIISLTKAMLNDKYISGLYGTNIFPYSRDDNAIQTLPALSVYQGEVNSYDNYDRLEGTIFINSYNSLEINRDSETEVLDTSLATLRMRIQNNNFAQQIALDMFEYNKTLAAYQNEFDKNCFIKAMQTRCPLQRFAINWKSKPGNLTKIAIGDCYKSVITFNYWIAQQDYYEFLELIGVDGRGDPNKIVYPPWEQFEVEVENIAG